MKTPSIMQLLIIVLPAMAILVAMAIVVVFYQVPIPYLIRDISSIAGVHPLSGVLSNLGVLLWCIAGSTCALAAIILRSAGAREDYLFLLCSALLSAYLMFDDLFLFHEFLAPRYFGLNEKVVYVLLGIAVSTYLVFFRKNILQTNVIVLLLALVCLSLSVVIDTIVEPWSGRLGDWVYFIEDGAKWLGIVFWCSYYLELSFRLVVGITDMPNNAIQSDAGASRC